MCVNEREQSGRVRLQEVEIDQVENIKCQESTEKRWKKWERGEEAAGASSVMCYV